jgi:hypothetical protein
MLPAIMGAVGALGEALKTPSATPGNVEQTMAAKTTLTWGSSFAVGGGAEAASEPTVAVSDAPAAATSGGGLTGRTWAMIGGGVLVLALGGIVLWKLSRSRK